MSFLTVLALGLALFVVAPTLAHLLRRGRAQEQDFPPTRLVPLARATTRERSKLEDRGLLALRALMIIALSVLGAGPLVRCSRVALGRSGGASVALAIVVDDSASMRARLPSGGGSRFERALKGARELLATAREGDAVALVQAGKPARLSLSASTDLHAARQALSELKVTDRATDLSAAIELARAALSSLPHRDKRIVLLSDLAGELPPEPGKDVWAAIPELATGVDDCGVLRAEQNGQRINVSVACSSENAARGRSLHLSGKQPAGAPEARLLAQRGEQTVTLETKAGERASIELTGSDQNPDNDRADVAPEQHGASVAVVADTTQEAVITGGAPILEQALHALSLDVPIRPLTELPREASELSDVVALFLDNPPGLTPETRGALAPWLESGAVAAVFLGQKAHDTQLGASLEPFARGALTWEPLSGTEVDAASLDWLGAEASSLKGFGAKGRARLDTALVPGAEVIGKWSDGKAFITRQERGRGLVFSVGLPVSVEVSDLPLRPAFLALLDRMVTEALRRHGTRESQAGSEWWFPASGSLQVTGSAGPLAAREADGQRVVTPELAGRYDVALGAQHESRFITLPAEEVLAPPKRDLPSSWRSSGTGAAPQVDASPELGWALLALLSLEIAVRLIRLVRERRSQGAIQPSAP